MQELKIQPIDYEKLNKLYKDFIPQKECSAKQTYFSLSSISSVSKTTSEKFASKTKPSMASMPSANPMLVNLIEMDKYYRNLLGLLEKNHEQESIFYMSKEEQRHKSRENTSLKTLQKENENFMASLQIEECSFETEL
ncbi:hypothetical protein Tco_0788825 [Tanacetum coccineum]